MGDLTGQTVLVTGGGRGIGRAICMALATAGADVAIVDRLASEAEDSAELVRQAGRRALALVGDVADPEFVAQAVERTASTFGALTGVVNNAGLGGLSPIETSEPAKWWKVVEVNLKGSYLTARFALPEMAKSGGRIVNIASEAGLEGRENASAYSASKGAVVLLTESIAREAARHGVCAFAIHPGGVLTPGSGAGLRPDSPLPESMKAEIRDLLRDPPELAAQLCVTLLSGKADALSGCYLSVHDDLDRLLRESDLVARSDAQRLRLRTLAG